MVNVHTWANEERPGHDNPRLAFAPCQFEPIQRLPLPGFPHYTVRHSHENRCVLSGIHFRYEPYKDRAKLWLPLRDQAIPGTVFARYDLVSLSIADPSHRATLQVPPHNICQSRIPSRGYIRLSSDATTYFKHTYAIRETRLVDDPAIQVSIVRATQAQPVGPPNQWKPQLLKQAYQLGLLEATAQTLGYDAVISADIHFQGGGSISRPDVIARMRRTVGGVTSSHLVIVEGKACSEGKAEYYVLEGTIQALHKKTAQTPYLKTADTIAAVTGQVKKLPWEELIVRLENADELPYSSRTRLCGREIWNQIRMDQKYWNQWYDEHMHVHGIEELARLAHTRHPQEATTILGLLETIRWR